SPASCQGKIDRMVGELVKAVKTDLTVLEIPVLFYPGMYGAAALTANMVNMLVVGNKCIFQSPYGPMVTGVKKLPKTSTAFPGMDGPVLNLVLQAQDDVFSVYTMELLRSCKLEPIAIDAWDVYHLHHGETHCATNTRREPVMGKVRWWEFEPGAGEAKK